MIEKEFVPYQESLELKELGFDEECFGSWEIKYSKIPTYTHSITKKYKNSNHPIGEVTVPTFSQVFRWFREKYNIVHTVYSNASGYIWELHYNQEIGGTHICDSGESGDCEMSGMFTTYEKAELECLKKLIEIVKKIKNEYNS